MNIIDKSRIRSKFASAIATYDTQAIAQKAVNARLIEILKEYGGTQFNSVLELGCGTGDFSVRLVESCSANNWVFNDLIADVEDIIRGKLTLVDFKFICGDSEFLEFNDSFDLIASASTVQWFENLEAFFINLYDHLNNDGLLLISTYLPDNLKEIKTQTSLSLNYLSDEKILNALRNRYELLYYEPLKVQLEFDSGRDMLSHLRETGVNAVSDKSFSLSDTRKFLKRYEEASALPNGKFSLTYSAFLFLAKKL